MRARLKKMETKHLSYFKVENFKRFESLEVNDIGQFNLVVGDNNVGKTTLLEALAYDDENYYDFLGNMWALMVQNRNINPKKLNSINLIDYYLNDKTNTQTYSYKYRRHNLLHSLSLTKKLRTELTAKEIDKLNGIDISDPNNQHFIEFSFDNKRGLISTSFEGRGANSYMPFIRFNLGYDNDLVDYFSKIILSNSKFEDLKKSIRFFIPNLTSIELNSAIVDGQNTIVVREEGKDELQSLTQYGDGTVKLFRYLLEFEFCQNARLMIDEIDTGIHYSRMKDFLKKIIQTAKNKNVQIFATTHSKECLQYYKEALAELSKQDEGRIIRIADTKSGIKAYTMQFAEFDNALQGDNEIR